MKLLQDVGFNCKVYENPLAIFFWLPSKTGTWFMSPVVYIFKKISSYPIELWVCSNSNGKHILDTHFR